MTTASDIFKRRFAAPAADTSDAESDAESDARDPEDLSDNEFEDSNNVVATCRDVAAACLAVVYPGEEVAGTGRGITDQLLSRRGSDWAPDRARVASEMYEMCSHFRDAKTPFRDITAVMAGVVARASESEGTSVAVVGEVFSLPAFAPHLNRHALDLELRAVGPKRRQGLSKCIRCESWSTETTEIQTRSADEGMTEKNVCFQCGLRWSRNA
jgi:DNA-directed RNA polymerase subunit M/transcription elongation factor TFIIS